MPALSLKRQSFIPPREKPWLVHLAQRIAPWVYRLALDAHMEVEPAGLQRLRALQGQAGIIVLNHPTIYDPLFAFGLSRAAGERWAYLCALEIFRDLHPAAAAALPWLNAYSVRRGSLDRPSIEMTRHLLLQQRKVVLFPEGETYGLNDALLPFQEGAVQIGFWALQDRERKGCAPAPLWLVPVAIKYRFVGRADMEIERRLRRLELRLGLPSGRGDLLQRVIRAGEGVLERLEREYRRRPAADADLNVRIAELRRHLLARTAQALQTRLRPDWTLPEQIRALFNAVHEMLYGDDCRRPAEGSAERQEWEATALFLHRQVGRLHAFQAVQGGYVPSYPTPERFLDLLARLEWEVTGDLSLYRPRVAVFRVEEPLDLCRHQADYRADKRGTVTQVTLQLRARLARGLHHLIARTQPLPGLDLAAVPYRVEPEAYLMPAGSPAPPDPTANAS